MKRNLFTLAFVLIVMSMVLAACAGAAPTESAPQETVPAEPAQPEATAAPAAPSGYGETLCAVQERGRLVCGVNGQVPGFSNVDPSGAYTGLDVDFCRAIAAAVFGDPEAVEYRPLTAADRFTALQSGDIDVLIRNTTWTLTRDSELNGNFVHTTFYDGQGMMVPVDSGFTTLEDLAGGTICVQTGTTTELNLADVMAARGIDYTPAVFDDPDGTYGAYAEGRCDAATSDKSQLVARKSTLPDPDANMIMDVTISKEPLGPMVRHGDDQWFDIVQWTVFTTFAGEEYDVSSTNVDDLRSTTENPEIRRLLGVEGELGAKLGLSNDWSYNVLSQVGNYAEIYDRNLGPDTPTYIPRGLNSLYTDGGLLYSPPFK